MSGSDERDTSPEVGGQSCSRREFLEQMGKGTLAVAAAGLLAQQLPGCDGSGEEEAGGKTTIPKRPNILLIMTDQEQQPRWIGDEALLNQRLPARMWLRRHGVEFTNAHYSALPCSPSRASIFSGLHAHQHQVYSNCGFDGNLLHPGFPTSASVLRDRHDYRTYYIGKSHLACMQEYPCSEDKIQGMQPYGFDEWVTGPLQAPFDAGLWPEDFCYDSFGYPGEGGKEDVDFADAARGWLKGKARDSSRPWFTVISLVNPHDIMYYPRFEPDGVEPVVDERVGNYETRDEIEARKPTCHAEYIQTYDVLGGVMLYPPRDDKDSPLNRPWRRMPDTYRSLMEANDGHLKGILEEVMRLPRKIKRNLIVIFTTDHGELAGSHGLRGKGPCMYQEQMNVPLIFVDFSLPHLQEMRTVDAAPAPAEPAAGRFIGQAGSRRHALASLLDLAPTIVTLGANQPQDPEAWRVEQPQMRGANLLPSLKSGREDDPLLAPDPRSTGTPRSDTIRDHVLATCDQSFAAGSRTERINVTTAPHIVSLRQQKRDRSGKIVSDYKLNLYYNWITDPDTGEVRQEEGKACAYVDWQHPYDAELYDLLETDLRLLEVSNLIPPDWPRERKDDPWPPLVEIDAEGKWVEKPAGSARREKMKAVYQEMFNRLVNECVSQEIRREMPTPALQGVQEQAWSRYQGGRDRGACDPMEIGDTLFECVSL